MHASACADASVGVELELLGGYWLRPTAYALRSGCFFGPQLADWALDASPLAGADGKSCVEKDGGDASGAGAELGNILPALNQPAPLLV